MTVRETDVFSVMLVFLFLLNVIVIKHDHGSLFEFADEEKSFAVQLLSEKIAKQHFKVPILPRKCLFFMLLLMCGDIESCPGPLDYNSLNNSSEIHSIFAKRGVKIFHLNVCGLLNKIIF